MSIKRTTNPKEQKKLFEESKDKVVNDVEEVFEKERRELVEGIDKSIEKINKWRKEKK